MYGTICNDVLRTYICITTTNGKWSGEPGGGDKGGSFSWAPGHIRMAHKYINN